MKDVKRFMMPDNTHIGGWIFPEKLIDSIWEDWHDPTLQHHKHPGRIFPSQAKHAKDFRVLKKTKESIEKAIYPHNKTEPWFEYEYLLQKCLEDYVKHYPSSGHTFPFSIKGKYNVQWYPKNGGYKILHHENSGSVTTIHRHLVFMTYLNDVEDGGTKFPQQAITTPCIKGLTLIWPAYFTHPHVGQISKKSEKMIVTGWWNFNDIYDDYAK